MISRPELTQGFCQYLTPSVPFVWRRVPAGTFALEAPECPGMLSTLAWHDNNDNYTIIYRCGSLPTRPSWRRGRPHGALVAQRGRDADPILSTPELPK